MKIIATVLLAVGLAAGAAVPAQAAQSQHRATWAHSHDIHWHPCHTTTHVGAALGYTVTERSLVCPWGTTVLNQVFVPTEEAS